MERLKQELDRLINTLPNEVDFRRKLESLVSVYPFNEYEYVISALLARIIHEQHSATTLRSGFSLFMNKAG